MPHADERVYEEMIAALETYQKEILYECQALSSAAKDCIDNTEDDNVVNMAKSLAKKIDRMVATANQAKTLADKLQDELDYIRRIKERNNNEE